MSNLIRTTNGTNNVVNRLRDEMDDMFARFFGPGELVLPTLTTPTQWVPRIDVHETEKELLVKVDLPGVDPKDIEMNIHEGVLTIRGEKKEEKEEKGKNYHRMERFTGSFYRTIPLPVSVDENGVTATSTKGVVTIVIPKKPESKGKKILVQNKES